jgi:GNAT superfamily N-acetyltransferase
MIKVRRVKKGDLSRMREVMESAFGDFFERQLGTRPRQVFGGAQYVHHRWLMEPWGCFVAEENEGKIVGVSVAVCWGALGLFGPVAVLTPYQNQKVAQQLVRAAQGFFDENRVTLQGVVTFPYSPKHLLVAITARSLERREPAPPVKPVRGTPEIKRFSTYEESKKKGLLARLRLLTGRIYRGLDLTKEIEIVDGLALGDTLLLEKDGAPLGFAICHTPGVSEAPQGALYIKYLVIDPARRRPEHFIQLLTACEDFGVNAGCQRIIAPVYTGYWRAYQTLLASGYHVDMLMLRMKRGKHDDYEGEEDFVLDDWR